jgi:hypothetical protein
VTGAIARFVSLAQLLLVSDELPQVATNSAIEYMSSTVGVRATRCVNKTGIASISILSSTVRRSGEHLLLDRDGLRTQFVIGMQLLLV